jgi:hypothetical protein
MINVTGTLFEEQFSVRQEKPLTKNGGYHTKPQRSLRKTKTFFVTCEHHFGEWL